MPSGLAGGPIYRRRCRLAGTVVEAGNVQPRPHINVMWIWIEGPRWSRVERQRAEMRRRGAVDDEDCAVARWGLRPLLPLQAGRRSSAIELACAVATGGLTGGAAATALG